MTWEQVVIIAMLAAPTFVVASIIADAPHWSRPTTDELFTLGFVTLWNIALALLLLLGGFW